MPKQILKQFSVLCVEDDAQVRASMCEFLGRYFACVYEAEDGVQAWECYQNHRPDVLISDVDMPKLDGLALIEKIRQENEHMPIVILSAYSDTPKLLKATELQLVKYLLKLVDPKVLKSVLLKVGERLLKNGEGVISLADGLVWFVHSSRLLDEGEAVSLSHKERQLMALLVSCRGACVTYEQIMAALWTERDYEEVTLDAVKFHVSSLRKKLPEGILKNVYGKGYMLIV